MSLFVPRKVTCCRRGRAERNWLGRSRQAKRAGLYKPHAGAAHTRGVWVHDEKGVRWDRAGPRMPIADAVPRHRHRACCVLNSGFEQVSWQKEKIFAPPIYSVSKRRVIHKISPGDERERRPARGGAAPILP
eukprot:6068016-Prymnesium_polylepis.1